ncbi:MFS transporter [Mycolicibacterium sp. P9-22]|uniref:MFS transporter n=1 Tax=Mycolicibacterium sp. P9-22 TaxID=2024613 RepID=UPI0011EC5C78|nr:MFS transporter [Mycolicibacterium sp. P9-22]KAA0120604.1 MFS transporter [Mycolicibacterium sp. P9-22]
MSEQKTRRLDRRYWQLAVAGGMASYLDSGVLISAGISLAIWKEHFGLDSWMLGIVSAGLGLAVAIGALFGGRIADLFGRTRVFNIDVFIYVIGVGLIALAVNPAMLIGGVLVAGVAAGADLPTSIAVIAERAPEGAQGRLVAFTQVMWTVGIVVATLLGFLVANLDMTGVRILFLHLFVVGLATGLVRVLSPSFKKLEAETLARNAVAHPGSAETLPLRRLLTTRYFTVGIVLTGLFYVFYGLVANTIGQFKTYFLVTVGDASQSTATGFSFVTMLIGLACALILTRLVDTKWRNPLFMGGNLLLIAGLVLTALTGGDNLALMFLFLVMYNLSNPFCGEALYKVWTQETFPVNSRATAQGLTYGAARLIFAGFALVTPALIEWSPSGLFWVLAGLAAVSGALGLALARRGQRTSQERISEPVSLF